MLEGELAEAYDYVSPCFPPHYNIFDSIFQLYHVQFAQVGGGPSVNACWRGKCGMLCELHDCGAPPPGAAGRVSVCKQSLRGQLSTALG